MLAFCAVLCYLHFIRAAPVTFNINIDEKSLGKLRHWGYLDEYDGNTVSAIRTQGKIKDAITSFQRYAGIPETGLFDAKTQEMMKAPRCGMPDYPIAKHRQKRFTPQGTKWNNNPVTWQLENSNNDGLTDIEIRDFVRRSLEKWSDAANIDFVELPPTDPIGSSQIRVSFEEGQHQDNFPFDGPSGTLAHAFFPLSNLGLSGDIHFDDAEVYTFQDLPRSSGTIKFLWVAVHEFGHSLGLSHSDLRGAVMYPWYLHFPGLDFNLTSDDIAGIRFVYGERPTTTAAATTTQTTLSSSSSSSLSPNTSPTASQAPNLCTNQINAPLLWSDDKVYFFKDQNMFVIGENGEGVEEVKSINEFPGLKKVDAVFRRQRDDLIVFFHGDSFSVYNGNKQLISTTRKISDGFQGLPEGFGNIDAALLTDKTKKLYIFKGDEYWRFTQLANNDFTMDFGYPLKIQFRWIGIPDNIDGVFTWKNGKIYFFKGGSYYRFDEDTLEVSSGYPQQLTGSFLKCSPTLQSISHPSKGVNLASSRPLFKVSVLLMLILMMLF